MAKRAAIYASGRMVQLRKTRPAGPEEIQRKGGQKGSRAEGGGSKYGWESSKDEKRGKKSRKKTHHRVSGFLMVERKGESTRHLHERANSGRDAGRKIGGEGGSDLLSGPSKVRGRHTKSWISPGLRQITMPPENAQS